jgi:glycerol-3-phosphate dehydrogenase (NAD(P)+)
MYRSGRSLSSVTQQKDRYSKSMELHRIAVVGAGAWGTSLALLAARCGHEVVLWARRAEQLRALETDRENLEHLPGLPFPAALQVTNRLEDLHGSDFALLVVPSSYLLEVTGNLPRDLPVVNAAKGLNDWLEPLTAGLQREGFNRVAVLSGPNLAGEVARGLPAASVVASDDALFAAQVQAVLGTDNVRLYTSNDVIGVSLGGALKNVVALGAGLVDGLGLGENARAALVTRGLRETVRFALAHGALESTMYGLAGVGDLLLTCAAHRSRNRMAGECIARGLPLPPRAIEGIPTAARVVAWAQREGLELPVCETIHAIVSGRLEPGRGVAHLMERGLKSEG